MRDTILSLAQRQPTAESLAQSALVWLADGRFEAAIDLLSEASHLEPRNPAILSDLAAAYLASARAQGSALAYFHALASAERALKIDPNLASAIFNRALALESLGIGWEAIKAWGRYQALDSGSPWADEARRHALLSRPRADRERLWNDAKTQLRRGTWNHGDDGLDRAVKARHLQARLFGEEELLAAWADHWRTGNRSEAGRSLSSARELGASLSRVGGDPLLADAVLAINRAKANERKATFLANAYGNYLDGLKAYASNDLSRSAALLSNARELFSRGGSPMSWRAAVQLANSLTRQGQYEQAKTILRVVKDKAPQRYLNLHGRASWILGVIAVIGSQYGSAHQHYEQALAFYKRSGESESAASLYALIAEYYYYTGDEEHLWENLRQALSLFEGVPQEKKDFILWCGSIASSMAGEPDLALLFHNKLVSLAEESSNPANLAAVLHGRATVRAEAQRYDKALQDIGAAWRALKNVPAGGLANTLAGDILLADSEIRRRRDGRGSLVRAQQALALFRRTDYQSGLPRALLAEARAYIVLKDLARAAEAISATLEEVSRQRLQILKSSDRIDFLVKMGMLFDEAAEYHLSTLHRPDLAYGFVEQGQALSLLDSHGSPSEEWPSPEILSRELDPGVVVLQFGVFESRTCVWALWKRGWLYHEVLIGEKELARQVELFRAAIFKDDRTLIRALGGELYQRLIEGVLRMVPQHLITVIVPSKSLHGLPFAALTNPSTRKYMIEENVLELSPSTRIYLKSLRAAKKHGGGAGNVLLVGDPEFDHSALPTLKRLPGSAEEVRRIALSFGDKAIVLTGRSATKRALLDNLEKASILHLSAHAIINPGDPLKSYLALAPDGNSGLLLAADLYGQNFGKLNLVFLAGCATASGPIAGNEGVMSLVRPFLASGAPVVIGTLWNMKDLDSSRGVRQFYTFALQGLSASAAMREVQLSLIAEPEFSAPALWSAFVVMGAGNVLIGNNNLDEEGL